MLDTCPFNLPSFRECTMLIIAVHRHARTGCGRADHHQQHAHWALSRRDPAAPASNPIRREAWRSVSAGALQTGSQALQRCWTTLADQVEVIDCMSVSKSCCSLAALDQVADPDKSLEYFATTEDT
eukprot:scaffold19082_cov21-Tisochrysis_lutea.AAC.1